jgi:hypothetical protein
MTEIPEEMKALFHRKKQIENCSLLAYYPVTNIGPKCHCFIYEKDNTPIWVFIDECNGTIKSTTIPLTLPCTMEKLAFLEKEVERLKESIKTVNT